MACLKIQVLGKGLIPRGLGIAPRKAPFNADLNLIQLILKTPGLQVRMVHPETGQLMNVTTQTLQRLWDKYSDKPVLSPAERAAKKKEAEQASLNPVAPVVQKAPDRQPSPGVTPAAAAMVKEAVNAAAAEVFDKNDAPKQESLPVKDVTGPVEEEPKKDDKPGVTVKPYNPDDHQKNKNKK